METRESTFQPDVTLSHMQLWQMSHCVSQYLEIMLKVKNASLLGFQNTLELNKTKKGFQSMTAICIWTRLCKLLSSGNAALLCLCCSALLALLSSGKATQNHFWDCDYSIGFETALSIPLHCVWKSPKMSHTLWIMYLRLSQQNGCITKITGKKLIHFLRYINGKHVYQITQITSFKM